MINKISLLLISLVLVSFSSFAANDIKINSEHWTLNDNSDPFTDKPKVWAGILAQAGSKGFIAVGCYGGEFEMKVSAGKYIGEKEIPNNLKYRVDDKPFGVATFKTASKPFMYSNDMSNKFLEAIRTGASKVILQTTSFDYDTSDVASFTLKGSTDSINHVLQACKK